MIQRHKSDPRRFYFGRRQEISYNSETGRVIGSDSCFLWLTCALIILPTLICLSIVILYNPSFDPFSKYTCTIAITASLFLSLRSLFVCSFSDPGIIPSLSKEEDPDKYDAQFKHQVQYMNEQELNEYFNSEEGYEADHAARFFHLRKFKYIYP